MQPDKRRRTHSPPPVIQTQPQQASCSHNPATTLPSSTHTQPTQLHDQRAGPSTHAQPPPQPSEGYRTAHIALEETLFYLSQKSAALGGRHVTSADLTMLQRDFATFMNVHPIYSLHPGAPMAAPAVQQQPLQPLIPPNQTIDQVNTEAIPAQQQHLSRPPSGNLSVDNNLTSLPPSIHSRPLPTAASASHLQDGSVFNTLSQQQKPQQPIDVTTDGVQIHVGDVHTTTPAVTAAAGIPSQQQHAALQLEQVFQTLDFEAISRGDMGVDARRELQELITLLGSVATMQGQPGEGSQTEDGEQTWAAAAVNMLQGLTGVLKNPENVGSGIDVADQQQRQPVIGGGAATLRSNIPMPVPQAVTDDPQQQAATMIASELEKKAFLAALRQQRRQPPPP